MLLSRSFYFLRQARNTIQPNNVIKNHVRNSSEGYVYRTTGHHANKKWEIVAETLMATAWWWWLWHVYHEYEWVTGEWDMPDPRKWTDEELGIPPDSE